MSTKRVVGLWRRAAATLRFWRSRYLDRRFDRRYGVETLREMRVEELYPDGEAPADAHRYQGVSVLDFEEMMRAVEVRHEDYVFLDLGSGKGKALILASRYGFQRLVGVELSRRLHEIAEVNLANFLERTSGAIPFELRCQDAVEVDWPLRNLFILIFNPFGRHRLESLFENLGRSHRATPRRLVVLCRRSAAVDVLERQSYLREVHRAPAYRIYVDDPGVEPGRDRIQSRRAAG